MLYVFVGVFLRGDKNLILSDINLSVLKSKLRIVRLTDISIKKMLNCVSK